MLAGAFLPSVRLMGRAVHGQQLSCWWVGSCPPTWTFTWGQLDTAQGDLSIGVLQSPNGLAWGAAAASILFVSLDGWIWGSKVVTRTSAILAAAAGIAIAIIEGRWLHGFVEAWTSGSIRSYATWRPALGAVLEAAAVVLVVLGAICALWCARSSRAAPEPPSDDVVAVAVST